jgi:adenosine deaminase
MFNTTLTQEFIAAATQFHFPVETIEQLTLNAIHAALLPTSTRQMMAQQFAQTFAQLRATVIPVHPAPEVWDTTTDGGVGKSQ